MTTIARARELPATSPSTARTTLTAEYAALLALVDGLTPADWAAPGSVLWRTLELQGDVETLRWLRPPHQEHHP